VVAVDDRDGLAAHLRSRDIATGCHYPRALSAQPALAGRSRHAGGANAGRWARSCLSLPLHLGLTNEDVEEVAGAVSKWTD
jgi:dTDP-4-amino-4,6-dideoxygalactose transaminase